MPEVVWQQCVDRLQNELPSQQFNTWIRPLQASMEGQMLTLLAPNRFIKDFVSDKFAERISELVRELEPDNAMDVVLEIGAGTSRPSAQVSVSPIPLHRATETKGMQPALSGQAVSGISRPADVTSIRPVAVASRAETARRVEVEGSLQHQPHLVENYTFDNDDVTMVDGGVLGFQLMVYYQEYDKVIILDTITMDDEVGSIYNLPSEELLGLGSYKQTAHEVEIIEMLEICSLLETMAEVNIIGIIPKDIETVVVGLTKEMRDCFFNLVNAGLSELDKAGIKYKKNEIEVTLDSIIDNYSYPKADRMGEH